MRVAVTGGAGFIGANLCHALAAAGHAVVAVDDLSTGSADNLAGTGATLAEGSILDRDHLADAFAGADAIVHLAARPSVPRSIADPGRSNEVNVTGTLNVLEQARPLADPYVIVASSSSVYGANPVLPKHEDLVPRPLSPYAVSKLAAEHYLLAYRECFGLRGLALRFFNVYGPLQPAGHAYAAVVPAFIDAALRGVPLTVHGDGKQSRDFTFVGSVVGLIAEALDRRLDVDGPVNLAFGTRVTLLELIGLLEGELGRDLEREHTDPRPGDVRDSQADQTRMRNLFPGIEPVAFDVGLRATVEWFLAHELVGVLSAGAPAPR